MAQLSHPVNNITLEHLYDKLTEALEEYPDFGGVLFNHFGQAFFGLNQGMYFINANKKRQWQDLVTTSKIFRRTCSNPVPLFQNTDDVEFVLLFNLSLSNMQ